MSCMKIAFENLVLLSGKENNIDDYHIIIDGPYIKNIEKQDDYNTLFTLRELEYPVLLTFERILFFVEHTYSSKYNNHTKQELMFMLDKSLDNLIYLYDNIEEQYKENTIFSDILDVLDDKYHLLDNQRDSTYVRLSEKMSLLFDSLVETFAESKKYLYISPKCFEFQRFYEEDTEETEDTEEVDGGECGEEETEETEEVDDEEETEETKEEEDDKVDSEESDNEDKKNDDKEVIDSMTKLLLNTMTEENKESIIDEALKSDNPKLSLLDLLKED